MTRPFEGGQSGYRLRLVDAGLVEKHSGSADGDRLERQCAKQRAFQVRHPHFVVGDVIHFQRDASGFRFVMPHYRADTATQFIDKARPAEVRRFIECLGELLDELLHTSSPLPLAVDILLSKSEDTIRRISGASWWARVRQPCLAHLDELKRLPSTLLLPLGRCHGDLTLSNVLFDRASGRFILLDFLDSYLETPLLDLAKLRQETRLSWSSLITKATHDRMKYRQVMARLDAHMTERFGRRDDVRLLGRILETQTLLRLLPYVRDDAVAEAIVGQLVGSRGTHSLSPFPNRN